MLSLFCLRVLWHYSGNVNQMLRIPAKLVTMLFPVTGIKATLHSDILGIAL